jgi:hypothetical protein
MTMDARQPGSSSHPHAEGVNELPAHVGGRYQVLEMLGRGGTAVVYRVRDRSATHDVALKQLHVFGVKHGPQALDLFEHEFQTLAQLRHPSVIEVYDYGIDQAGPYYTMELLDGGDLSGQAPLPSRQACQLMMQVCSSLSLLHSRRLLHRDVSPRNVRRTRNGSAKLIDFGAMVPMGPCLLSIGTPGFTAPEVVHHLSLDARTDLFSLGATLYFALTGRRPFAARTLAELNEAFRTEPSLPSKLAPDVPVALDELVMSLLRIDPARRPRSAFEVMQRLAAIAGAPRSESDDIYRSYLSTPTLVGRDSEQRRFRQCLKRARQSEGGALLFEAESGMGRSRLLDVCVLEGKTAGAVVLQLDGSTERQAPFASVHRLAYQLAQAMPDSPRQDLADPALFTRLFESGDPAAFAELVPWERFKADPESVQAALLAWFRAASERRLLMIAIDDLERIDHASLAWIVALVDGAHSSQLMVVATHARPADEQLQPALAVLRRNGVSVTLEALSAEHCAALLTSIFFDAPHVALVSDRIHQLAVGRPRETMALVQHLLNAGHVRYSEGNWVLPGDLSAADLPASAEDALRLRVARLGPLARRLAEAHALALEAALTRADYLALGAPAQIDEVDAALVELVEQGVLAGHGERFTLSRLGVARNLISQLSAADAVERQRALTALCVGTKRPLLFEVHHRLQSADHARALERLAPVLKDGSNATAFADTAGLSRKTMADIIERAHAAAVRGERPAREINDLRRVLIELSPTTDKALFDRHAPRWLEQLERDSGLHDYRALPADLPPALRLQSALSSARGRVAATVSGERVYEVEEAIKYLARYVTFAGVRGSKGSDTRLLGSLPPTLQPFAAMTPLLHAIHANVTAQFEMACEARLERARARYRAAYQMMQGMADSEIRYADAIRSSVATGIARVEVMLGYGSALQWIEIAEQHPMFREYMLFLRRILCVFEGDLEGAERYRRQAEVFCAQASTRQVYDLPATVELYAQIHARDLAGVQHVAERIARLAADSPGWLPLHHAAQGHFQRMRGDLQTARREFEQALALVDLERADPPPPLPAWISAAAGYVQVLTELGEIEQACRVGAQVVARAEALEVTEGCAHICALALAEAKAGHHERAAQRLDRVIAELSGRNPALVAAEYEARALVAIWANDHAAARRFAELATRRLGKESTPLQLARRGRLLDEAARVGMPLEIAAGGVESVVLAHSPRTPLAAIDPRFIAALEGLRDPATRSARTLQLLCEAAEARAGRLYGMAGGLPVACATHGALPHEALDRFVEGYFRQEVEQAAMSTIFTVTEQATGALALGHWLSPTRQTYCVALLKPANADEYVGAVALLAPQPAVQSAAFSVLVWALSKRLLELGCRTHLA